MIFAAVALLCLVAYLVYAVPGPWFPRAPRLTFSAPQIVLTRGTGELADRGFLVSKPDATGLALVSIATDFRAADYPAIEWRSATLPRAPTCGSCGVPTFDPTDSIR